MSTANAPDEGTMANATLAHAEKKVHGVVAEFTDVDSLLAACRRIRDAGYKKTDAFTPFAVHGIDEALGIKATVLPWIALAAGLTGTCVALLMQIGMNGDWFENFSYPYIISGKPYVSIPAFIPVAFELTILLASFGTFFGMWALNGLPRFSNPIFTNPRFDRVTDDTFFLYIDAKDGQFNQSGVEKLLADAGGLQVTSVVDDDTTSVIPKFLLTAIVTVIALSFIPLLVVAKMRVTKSGSPRFHIFFDMDFSPAKDAQQVSSLFSDNRSMRPDVSGTVARSEFKGDLDYLTGIDMEKLAAVDQDKAQSLVAFYAQVQDVEPAPTVAAPTVAVAAVTVAAEDNTPWLSENPLEITMDVLERGQQQFGIYCMACHGLDGRGNGLVNQRAQRILAASWVPPSNMHDSAYYDDKYADGKLFSTITNGVRKMPGYASQIKPSDRWAVVAYVRALQKSQNATLEMVPESDQSSVKAAQAKAKADLEAAAKAEQERLKKVAEEAAKEKAAAEAEAKAKAAKSDA